MLWEIMGKRTVHRSSEGAPPRHEDRLRDSLAGFTHKAFERNCEAIV
jgi:hypothetical protein